MIPRIATHTANALLRPRKIQDGALSHRRIDARRLAWSHACKKGQ